MRGGAKKMRFPILILVLVYANLAFAQETALDRSEVAEIKQKLVTVQEALGGNPEGYTLESEEFNLPTDYSPAEDGKFWPITSSVSLRFGDKASKEGQDSAEQAAANFKAKYRSSSGQTFLDPGCCLIFVVRMDEIEIGYA